MPDDDLTAGLDRLSKIEQAATAGPWWSDESDDCWRLHGVAFKVPPHLNPDGSVLIPEQVMNKQIAKAPKHGTPYAEYWPDEADAEFIVTSRTAMPRLVAALRAVLGEHQPVDRSEGLRPICGTCHKGFWPCPTYLAITREITGAHPSAQQREESGDA